MAVDGEMDALTYDGYIEKMRRIEYPMLKGRDRFKSSQEKLQRLTGFKMQHTLIMRERHYTASRCLKPSRPI
jgi:hypothetical protein